MFVAACQLGDYEMRQLIKWAEGENDVDELVDMVYSADDLDRQYYIVSGKWFIRENGLG